MFGRATITLGIGPHCSYIYYIILCPNIVMHAKRVCTQCLENAVSSTMSSKFLTKQLVNIRPHLKHGTFVCNIRNAPEMSEANSAIQNSC